jgi:2-polyprenyl-3-methyl-5-hydroxy-6-metoxy-1,4-benzoquinol methylase
VDRADKILHLIDKSGYGIEIGPSYNPVAPKSAGYKVQVIDHMDREHLIERFKGHSVQLENIEEVDYVWKGERYVELTGKKNFYGWIIASHVIEHTPDLISFLDSCAGILKDDGVLSLAIPDVRYCFDFFRPITGLSKIIDAHFQNHVIHTPGTVSEYCLNVVSKGGQIAWSSNTEGVYAFVHSLEDARQALNKVIDKKEHIDVHAWCFTPTSFRLMIHDLYNLGLTTFRELAFFPTEGCEFYVTLGRKGTNYPLNRLMMLKQIKVELSVSEKDMQIQ